MREFSFEVPYNRDICKDRLRNADLTFPYSGYFSITPTIFVSKESDFYQIKAEHKGLTWKFECQIHGHIQAIDPYTTMVTGTALLDKFDNNRRLAFYWLLIVYGFLFWVGISTSIGCVAVFLVMFCMQLATNHYTRNPHKPLLKKMQEVLLHRKTK